MSTNNNNFLINTVVEAYNDLCKVDAYLSDIRGSIRSCLDAREDLVDFNLTEEIGIYAQQLPELKFLSGKLEIIQTGIRMICSGELSLKEGFKATGKYLDMVAEALACFNVENVEANYADTADEESHNCNHQCNCDSDCNDNCTGNCKCNCEKQHEGSTDNCEVTCEANSENLNYGENATDEDGCDFKLIIKGSKEDIIAAINCIM